MPKTFRLFLLASALLFVAIYYKLLLAREIFTHDSIKWYGSYHYFVESLSKGVFPLWDPYTIAGTPFYQNIPLLGNLDPTVLLSAIVVRLGITPLTAYIYLHLARLLLFSIGAYYLFKFISGCKVSAAVAACVLLFSMMPVNLREHTVNMSFLSPFALYFLLRFFNDNELYKKYLFFFLFTLATGITFNVYIPSYFLLNIISFFVVAALFKMLDIKKTVLLLRFKLIPLAIFFIVLTTSMSAPSLSIYSDSISKDSEPFPILRVIQLNDGIFKKIMASDIGDDVLSQKFTKNLGVYSTWGNLLNLLYPDLWKYYSDFRLFKYPDIVDIISETFQYIGIIPFIIALIGLVYSKSRWRLLSLVMLVIISINMISLEGVHHRHPNALQSLFNTMLPFLKMIDVRETLSGFFLLWLCALLALGLRIFFDRVKLKELVDGRLRMLLLILAALIAGKALFTYTFWGNSFYISYIDIAAFGVILVFALLIYLYHKNILGYAYFCTIVILIIFADIGYYNISIKPNVLIPNIITPVIASKANQSNDFIYIRIPFMYFNGLQVAFSEPMFNIKGAMLHDENHIVFTTKRFYDYFTHVPLEKQFILSGIDTPIIRFFTKADTVIFKDKLDVLTHMSNADEEELRSRLFIEEALDNGTAVINKSASIPLEGLDQYPALYELKKNKIIEADNKYMIKNAPRVMDIVDNPNKYLNTSEYSIEVKDFTPNDLTLNVNNSVDGYLYYNDGWSKYWRAYDNGSEIPIKIANYNFKAVFLPKGRHNIVFDYDPWQYKLSLVAYTTGIFLTMFLVVYFAFKVTRIKLYVKK